MDIEKLASAVHIAYCKNYFKRNGFPYWTNGDYSLLNEETKEIDRATVRAVLRALKKQSVDHDFTTRASRNTGGGKQSRPALRKARDVVRNYAKGIK